MEKSFYKNFMLSSLFNPFRIHYYYFLKAHTTVRRIIKTITL